MCVSFVFFWEVDVYVFVCILMHVDGVFSKQKKQLREVRSRRSRKAYVVCVCVCVLVGKKKHKKDAF